MNADDKAFGRREQDAFDVRSSLLGIRRAVRHHRLLVAGTCLATVALMTAYMLVWPPVYKATALLMVERDSDPVRDTFYVGWNVFRKDDARTEIELMKSGPVLKQVVEAENLAYDDVYHPFQSHLSYLWGRSFVGRAYRAAKSRIFPDEAGAYGSEELERIRTILDLRAGISVEPVVESNIGRLTVKGPSRRVAGMANRLIDVYLAHRAERYRTEAKKAYDILSRQVAEANGELSGIEVRRLDFIRERTLAFDFQKEGLEIQKLTDLEGSIASSRARQAAIKASLAEVDGQLASDPPTRVPASIREATKMKRADAEASLIQARLRYREDSPEVQMLARLIERLDAVIADGVKLPETVTSEGLSAVQQDLVTRRNALRSELSGVSASLAVMDRSAAELRSRLSGVPGMQATLRALDREYALSQEKYQQLLAKQAQAAVSLATSQATMPSMRVVEYAVPPPKKDWPKARILLPASLMIGLLLGVGSAIVKSYSDGRVRRGILEHGRSPLPVYGTVHVPAGSRPLVTVSGTGHPDLPGRREPT